MTDDGPAAICARTPSPLHGPRPSRHLTTGHNQIQNPKSKIQNHVGLKSALKRPWLGGRIFWGLPSQKPLVAPTFDDGPHPEFTPRVLDILAAHGAKGTFFCVGKAARAYPDLVKR